YSSNILPSLIQNIGSFSFDCRKEISLIYAILLRRKIGTREPTIDYLNKNPHIIHLLCDGYNQPEAAVFVGSMLRESLKHESLASILLDYKNFFSFFKYVQMQNFDIASDAFSNFRVN
ncbi:MO25-like protein 2, partial [Smittium culicis]